MPPHPVDIRLPSPTGVPHPLLWPRAQSSTPQHWGLHTGHHYLSVSLAVDFELRILSSHPLRTLTVWTSLLGFSSPTPSIIPKAALMLPLC